jgi:hypothetical protein
MARFRDTCRDVGIEPPPADVKDHQPWATRALKLAPKGPG